MMVGTSQNRYHGGDLVTWGSLAANMAVTTET